MNTLSKAITAHVFVDSQRYTQLRLHWRELMLSPRKHELAATHHLLYLILLGRDWRKAFTCASNRRKLENGAFQGWIMFRAIGALHSSSREADLLAPFDGLVTPEMLQPVRQLVPVQNPYRYQSDQFTAAGFPFEAYVLPTELTTAKQDAGNA